MIISRIEGGIGSQMACYSTARRLAHKLNTELKLDLEWHRACTAFPFALDQFNITATIASPEELAQFKKICQFPCAQRLPSAQELSNMTGDIYLQQYFPGESYFADIRDILLKEFTLKKLSPNAEAWQNKILSAECAVSMHFRHGDFLYSPHCVDYPWFHVPPLDYYYNCLNLLKQAYKNLTVFVFSNNIPWVKENLKLDVPTEFVEEVERDRFSVSLRRDVEQIYLMSLCKHNINPRSAFSWWASYLNQNPDKKVFVSKSATTEQVKNYRYSLETKASPLDSGKWIIVPFDRDKQPNVTMQPIFSLLLVVNDNASSISDTLNSLLEQDYKYYEVIIIDNASTDGSDKICQQAVAGKANITFKRLDSKVSNAVAWNTALKTARGQLVSFLNNGDRFLPNALTGLLYVNIWRNSEVIHMFARLEEDASGNITLADKKYSEQRDTRFKDEKRAVVMETDGQAAAKLLLDGQINNFLGTKIYNCEFLKDNGIKFDEHLADNEAELAFQAEAFSKSKYFMYISNAFYVAPKA